MSTPRETRSAARQQRQQNLQPPNHGLGRADLIRSRSPSPSPQGASNFPSPPKRSTREIEEEQFQDARAFTEPATMATPEQWAVLREQLRNELRDEVRAEFRNETAAAAATIPDAIRRKPEIPPFDKAHVEIWIKRTENAFIRANIRNISEKFAFLETKFPVGFDPRIDEYLYGDASPATWTSFLDYLRKEFGPTKQQRAAIFLDGLKREGRKPSQYAATLDDKTKGVTIDEIKKEMLLREMPTDVRRMLQERVEALTFKEAAKIADSYFDSEGRPRHVNQSTSDINEVSEPLKNTRIEDEDEVNAVNRRFPQRPNNSQQRRPGNQSKRNESWMTTRTTSERTNEYRPGPDTRPKTSIALRENRRGPTVKDARLCKYHIQYGDQAITCEKGCDKYPKGPSNDKAGRQA